MAKPTFNIQDLVTPVGRSPANPFQLPSLAQQNPKPRPVSDRTELQDMLGASPETGFLQNAPPSPTPTPTPVPQRRPAPTGPPTTVRNYAT